MGEPAPPRHRRRERRRARPDGQAPREYGSPGPTPPAEPAPQAPVEAPVPDPPAAVEPPRESGAAGRESGAAGRESSAAGRESSAAGREAARSAGKRARRADLERGLRGIVGAGPSQVGIVGAMRARDAARPTAEDLAAAERDVVIVRRHYVPPDTLPGAR